MLQQYQEKKHQLQNSYILRNGYYVEYITPDISHLEKDTYWSARI